LSENPDECEPTEKQEEPVEASNQREKEESEKRELFAKEEERRQRKAVKVIQKGVRNWVKRKKGGARYGSRYVYSSVVVCHVCAEAAQQGGFQTSGVRFADRVLRMCVHVFGLRVRVRASTPQGFPTTPCFKDLKTLDPHIDKTPSKYTVRSIFSAPSKDS